MQERIRGAIHSPHDLESLYRADPSQFAEAFPEVFDESPDSPILQVWRERLYFDASSQQAAFQGERAWTLRELFLLLVLAFIAGSLAKIPLAIPELDAEAFYTRNLAPIVIGALLAYFCIQRRPSDFVVLLLAALTAGSVVFLNQLPDESRSQTVLLACVHMPFVLWTFLGTAFLRGDWRNLAGRMDYLRYNGELLVHTTVILVGGMVLSGIFIALFLLINEELATWYLNNVVVYGAVASPIVATFIIDKVIGERFKLAPLIAKVFTPLFLFMVVVYLLAMVVEQRSPFTDRDFLIAFNALLVVVLGMCVLSISERGATAAPGITDYMNIALVATTLLIDLIALSAILFRLSAYGFTPNRLAVLGINILAFCHLAGILFFYVRFIRQRAPFDALTTWIVRYIPAYTAWSVLVAIGFPLAYWLLWYPG